MHLYETETQVKYIRRFDRGIARGEALVADRSHCTDDGLTVMEADTDIEFDLVHRGNKRLQPVNSGQDLTRSIDRVERRVQLVITPTLTQIYELSCRPTTTSNGFNHYSWK